MHQLMRKQDEEIKRLKNELKQEAHKSKQALKAYKALKSNPHLKKMHITATTYSKLSFSQSFVMSRLNKLASPSTSSASKRNG